MSDALKEAGLILTDLGPCVGVICRAEDSWLACATLKAARPPLVGGSVCLPCSKSLAFALEDVGSSDQPPLSYTSSLNTLHLITSHLLMVHYYSTAIDCKGKSTLTETGFYELVAA